MSRADLEAVFRPVLTDIAERSLVADSFLDKDIYRVYIATLWANVVLDPADVGIGEDDLEDLHDIVNSQVAEVLGAEQDIRECFKFVNSKSGEQAMQTARLTKNHKDLLLYFSSMILDPDGHKRWMDYVSDNPGR
jgi:hypothetical protein